MGDPLLRNPFPPNVASVQLPDNSTTLELGQTVEIAVNTNEIAEGTAFIRLFEAETENLYTNEPYSVTYLLQGEEVGYWETEVVNHAFTANVFVPETAQLGEHAKIVCYIQNEFNENVISYAYPLTIIDGNSSAGEDILVAPMPVLHQNYPNPFNPSTTIKFSLPESANVHLAVFNIKGQKVRTLTDQFWQSGTHEVVWNGKDENRKDAASGMYMYRLEVNGKTEAINKCVMMK
jgi:hypothetical protein